MPHSPDPSPQFGVEHSLGVESSQWGFESGPSKHNEMKLGMKKQRIE